MVTPRAFTPAQAAPCVSGPAREPLQQSTWVRALLRARSVNSKGHWERDSSSSGSALGELPPANSTARCYLRIRLEFPEKLGMPQNERRFRRRMRSFPLGMYGGNEKLEYLFSLEKASLKT